jgi:Plasmid pRiA4b ORF-3-like protein
VDHLDCGAAAQLVLLGADHLPEALETMRDGGVDGVEITKEALDAAELRWQVENALDARAVHDSDQAYPGTDDIPVDEDGPPDYPALAVLLRARMNALPVPSKPTTPHEDAEDRRAGLTALHILAQLAGNGDTPFGARAPIAARSRTTPGTLPAKRKKSDRPAPIYQIKVGLRGSKPPIWRRLEVPADVSLARLHTIIQVAFDWYDSHMHVFETPYGEFGVADPELGHRAEAPVTLEQVAPGARSKIRYTYDFGDDWAHDILVEKVLDRDEAVSYPRCTGGRRAAPPEDCGGTWGYGDLTEVLTDPAHPEHDDKLEWLGLNAAADFAPASFDAQAVTQALTRLR